MVGMNSNETKTPWIAHYDEGVPATIEDYEHQNLSEFIQAMCVKYADKPAFTNFGTTLTYDEVYKKATYFAAYLQNTLHYQKGDRLAIMMPNLLQYPVVFYGCLIAGIEVVNVNPLHTVRELAHQLKDSKSRGIIVVENSAYTLEQALPQLPDIKDIIVTSLGDELGTLKGCALNFIAKYVKKMVPKYNLNNALRYTDVLEQGKSQKLTVTEAGLDDTAILQYTGGTTGLGKGAMLTHRNILSNTLQVRYWVSAALESEMVSIAPLPLYHIFCCTVNALCLPGLGVHTVLITDPRNIKMFVKILSKYKFGSMTGLNTLFKGLLRDEGFAKLDFSHLKFVVSGGMALDRVTSEAWQKVTGNVIIEGYGLTETSPIVAVNKLFSDHFTDGVGFPVPSTLVKICDDDHNEVPTNQVGEMWVKGPQVMKGYWNKPEENVNIFDGDWLRTGDMAVMDERGFIKIVDRKKDMVLVSGFNVYPTEIEAILSEHPNVAEIAAIGVPDEKAGQAVKVFVVAKQESPTLEQELRDFASKNLSGYKKPKYYELCDDLPKSNVGKVLRRKLVTPDDPKA